MLFEALTLLTIGAAKVLENGRNKSRIDGWKQDKYNEWLREGGNPPPISSSWWDEAIREQPYCHTVCDSLHFSRCKNAFIASQR